MKSVFDNPTSPFPFGGWLIWAVCCGSTVHVFLFFSVL
jgi:hypothetical protein